MNGKATSNVGQQVALWPVFPHEKHFTSDQLRRTGRGLNCWFRNCFSLKYVCNLVSNFFGSAGAGETGFLLANFAPSTGVFTVTVRTGSESLFVLGQSHNLTS